MYIRWICFAECPQRQLPTVGSRSRFLSWTLRQFRASNGTSRKPGTSVLFSVSLIFYSRYGSAVRLIRFAVAWDVTLYSVQECAASVFRV
jgi:hypothetical protein